MSMVKCENCGEAYIPYEPHRCASGSKRSEAVASNSLQKQAILPDQLTSHDSLHVTVIKAMLAFEIAHFKKAKYLIIDEATHTQLKTELAEQMLGISEAYRISDMKTMAGMTVVLVKAKPFTIEFGF